MFAFESNIAYDSCDFIAENTVIEMMQKSTMSTLYIYENDCVCGKKIDFATPEN